MEGERKAGERRVEGLAAGVRANRCRLSVRRRRKGTNSEKLYCCQWPCVVNIQGTDFSEIRERMSHATIKLLREQELAEAEQVCVCVRASIVAW